jgi:hypothetical protein
MPERASQNLRHVSRGRIALRRVTSPYGMVVAGYHQNVSTACVSIALPELAHLYIG